MSDQFPDWVTPDLIALWEETAAEPFTTPFNFRIRFREAWKPGYIECDSEQEAEQRKLEIQAKLVHHMDAWQIVCTVALSHGATLTDESMAFYVGNVDRKGCVVHYSGPKYDLTMEAKDRVQIYRGIAEMMRETATEILQEIDAKNGTLPQENITLKQAIDLWNAGSSWPIVNARLGRSEKQVPKTTSEAKRFARANKIELRIGRPGRKNTN